MTDEQGFGPAYDYLRDAWQRSILFAGCAASAREHLSGAAGKDRAPRARIRDGVDPRRPRACKTRELRARPHHSARGQETDPRKRPFVVVDPRAGHGPGIGGMKEDSEIGVALRGGPSLLFHRLPARARCPARRSRMCGRAEAAFRRRGRARAIPRREGKPAIIANCQAGWQIDDHGGGPAGAVRSDPARRVAAVLLGRACAARTRCAISAACWAAPG